ncbi:MAG: internal scaffolding protein [Microviridae sp.]|nr:MAG: internal scaffolding protein [Microviridae sp.]
MSYNPKNLRPISTLNSFIQSNYSPKTRLSLTFPAISPHTKQEFKDECDINILMSKYQSTGQMPILNQSAPQYLDCTGFEFQSSMEFVAGAQSMFNELPSHLRNRFQNDPGTFLDFCSDENNRPEMLKLGLLKPQTEWADPNPYFNNSTGPKSNLEVPVPPTIPTE